MIRRPVTSMDPWQAEQDELDRVYEHAPVNERPLFPPSPSPLSPAGTARGQHSAPADDIPSMAGAHVLTTSHKD